MFVTRSGQASTMSHLSRTIRRSCTSLVVVALAVTGCGDAEEPPEGPEAQPAPDVTRFQEGDFEGLPLPTRSTPVSERTEEDGTVTQSFEVRNVTPEAVLSFYREALADHSVVEEPGEIGVGTHRGRWKVDGRELTVLAQAAETLEDNPGTSEVLTQLSLVLRPAGAAAGS